MLRRDGAAPAEAMPYDRASTDPESRHDRRQPGARRSGGRAARGHAGAGCDVRRAEPQGAAPGAADRFLHWTFSTALDAGRAAHRVVDSRRARSRHRHGWPSSNSRVATATLRWPAWPRLSRSTIDGSAAARSRSSASAIGLCSPTEAAAALVGETPSPEVIRAAADDAASANRSAERHPRVEPLSPPPGGGTDATRARAGVQRASSKPDPS